MKVRGLCVTRQERLLPLVRATQDPPERTDDHHVHSHEAHRKGMPEEVSRRGDRPVQLRSDDGTEVADRDL